MSTPIRIGAVKYLNTKPLVYQLDDHADRIQLSFDLPSRLADQLADNQLDVALIPAIEYFRQSEYQIVSDACIACRGPVLSVKLFSRRPPPDIKTLALDEGSRTSAAMVQVLLAEEFGIRPQLTSLPIGAELDQAKTDAVLLIGDRAIHARDDAFVFSWDLGELWTATTQLPFVFAMWVARLESDMSQVSQWLHRARDAGLAHLAEIAAAESGIVGMSSDDCVAYLRDNLHFHLGPHEQEGLQLFYDKCQTLGLAPAGCELRYDLSQAPAVISDSANSI